MTTRLVSFLGKAMDLLLTFAAILPRRTTGERFGMIAPNRGIRA
jgi:hypothetical protein